MHIGRKIGALNYPDCSFGGKKATGLQHVNGSDDGCGHGTALYQVKGHVGSNSPLPERRICCYLKLSTQF